MTSLLTIFAAALAFAAALFGSRGQRSPGLLAAGLTAAIVAFLFPTSSSQLAVVGSGVLLGCSASRRGGMLGVTLGVTLVALSAVMGELEVGGSTLFPLRFVATLFAGAGCGWILQSYERGGRRRMVPLVILTVTVLCFGLWAAHDWESGMALLPVVTTPGAKALLVFRGDLAVEAFRWTVPIAYSGVALCCVLASVPVGVVMWLRGRRGNEPVQGDGVLDQAYGALVGALLLVIAFLVWGRAPEILASTPDAPLLEVFRPASVSSDWEVLLRPLAESYRLDWFSVLPLLFAGTYLLFYAVLSGLRADGEVAGQSSVSLWPASLAFTLSAMFYAAFQVDVAGDTWAFGGGASPMLAAALAVAGLELQVGLSRPLRSQLASVVTLISAIVWMVYWSSTV